MSKNCIRCVKNDRTGFDLLCDECRNTKRTLADAIRLLKETFDKLDPENDRDAWFMVRITKIREALADRPRQPHIVTCAGKVSRPTKPIGHHGSFATGVVTCSWCHARTPALNAEPPFTIVCAGCGRNVRVEVEQPSPLRPDPYPNDLR